MKRQLIAAFLGLTSAAAGAEYVGPSTVPTTTVKQLLESGQDDQYATLQGRLISHDGGKRYTFSDETGRLQVEIAPRLLPTGSIDSTTRVEISGEFDKELMDKPELEVEQIKILP